VNPLDLNSIMKTSMPRLLRSLVRLTQAEVETIYILTPDVAISGPTILKESLRRPRGFQLKEPKVFIKDVSSLKKSVRAFCRYSELSKADLIIVSMNGNTKLRRLMLRQFAQVLLPRSRIPVLTTSSKLQFQGKWSRLLYPTDFGKHSERVFTRVIALARILKAEIMVYHEARSPRNIQARRRTIEFNTAVDSVPSAWVDSWVARRTRMQEYVDRARKSGVIANAFLDVGGLPLHEAILRAARKLNARLIATASFSGPVKSAISGAVTKRVVNNSHCPVWILHEKALR